MGEKNGGRYGWKFVRDESDNVEEVRGTIYVNECRMKNLSYTEEETLGVIRHERGHARGWDHGEGTPRPTRPTTTTTTSTVDRASLAGWILHTLNMKGCC